MMSAKFDKIHAIWEKNLHWMSFIIYLPRGRREKLIQSPGIRNEPLNER